MQEALRSQGPANMEMTELLKGVTLPRSLRRGDILEGQIVRIDRDGMLISVGQKTEGVVPLHEMRSLEQEDLRRLKAGDEVLTYVIRPDSEEGIAILSIDRARSEMGWHLLRKHHESRAVLEGRVTGYNKGGLIVNIQGVPGFIPMSQLMPGPKENSDSNQASPLAKRVGEVVKLQVLELDRPSNRVIFSEKAAFQEEKMRRREELMERLKEGEIRRGKVTGLSTFGAFVDIGGTDGLVHVSELAWEPVSSPEQVVSPGQEIDVLVLKVDKEQKRISLSLKRTQPEPWEAFAKKHRVGDLVQGTVTKLVNFGAFVKVEGNVEGLVHISELANRPLRHPREAVREGEEFTLKIVRMEPERRRLGLSLREAQHESGMGL